jgi:hypothetical protein
MACQDFQEVEEEMAYQETQVYQEFQVEMVKMAVQMIRTFK